MNIGELINKKRTELGLTLEEVGNAVGVSKSTVKKWEDGFISNMKRDKISKLAKVLEMNPVSLITGEEMSASEDEIDVSKYSNIKPVKKIKLPMLGKIACGEPIFADEEHETYVEVDESYGADFCLTAQGDSMINAGIENGDTVLIREAPIVENGEIAAVIIDDEATLKRVYYYKGENKLVLQAENPRYSPFVYLNEELETIRIIGKAVAVIKHLK